MHTLEVENYYDMQPANCQSAKSYEDSSIQPS